MEEVKVKKRPEKNLVLLDKDIVKAKDGDVNCRINYLYQLAHVIYPLDPLLARSYIREMKSMASKNVVRVDTTIKHTCCKSCGDLFFMSPATIFTYESNIYTISVEGKKQSDVLKVKCGHCKKITKLFNI